MSRARELPTSVTAPRTPTHLKHAGKLRPRHPEGSREEICLRRPSLNSALVCGVPGIRDPALRPLARYSPAQCRGVPSGPGRVTARGATVAALRSPVSRTGPLSRPRVSCAPAGPRRAWGPRGAALAPGGDSALQCALLSRPPMRSGRRDAPASSPRRRPRRLPAPQRPHRGQARP